MHYVQVSRLARIHPPVPFGPTYMEENVIQADQILIWIRIRRVKCDEAKPTCNRCRSGRVRCDGYNSDKAGNRSSASSSRSYTPSSASDSSPSEYQPLIPLAPTNPLPRRSQQELRSFEYFRSTTAPSLCGIFNIDFWHHELPKACQNDAALWHAVVCLGAVHECVNIPGSQPVVNKGDPKLLFGIQQFNWAVKYLIQLQTVTVADKWRALTMSLIFNCVCALQGMQEQAMLHLAAAEALLEEVSTPTTASKATSLHPKAEVHGGLIVGSIKAVLLGLVIQARAFQNAGLVGNFHLLLDSDPHNAWRVYERPKETSKESIAAAGRAAESLFNGIIIFSQQRAKDIAKFVTGDRSKISELVMAQESFIRVYKELSAAIQTFSADITPQSPFTSAVTTLRLFLAVTRTLLYTDPDSATPIGASGYAAIYDTAVNLSESVLQTPLDPRAPPMPTPTQPLFLVAHSGFPQRVRRRAVAVLRAYPRREGMWDTSFNAAVMELIMRREGSWDGDVTPAVTRRIHGLKIRFDGIRRARVTVRTWEEWQAGLEGEEALVQW
jgi:hypothetical protein